MVVDLNKTNRERDLILADPPWQQKKRGAAFDYPTLPINEIEKHIETAAKHTPDNSVLFLWTIDKYLIEAQRTAEGLGYKLHARLIWNKLNGIPAAFTARYGHEYLLYMYRGKFPKIAQNERGKILTVFEEKVKRHSQKPEKSFEIIERLYPNARKLEMYARQQRNGWDCFGNEV